MGSDLRYWESRLTDHFEGVCRLRSKTPGRPTFALEHGLNEQERNALAMAVQADVAHASPSAAYGLSWVVYASEIGYRYSGDEYWQTFEDETPGWIAHGDRYWLRERYRAFERRFHGAQPKGPWAEHFSIICWPITHAILPCDLQRQLAQILYEVRHLYSAEVFESPQVLGEFVAARSWNATTRFQNFVQDPALVGQIAAALLLQGKGVTEELIHPATLKRIGDDLDRERRAREWLRSAREFANARARLRGFDRMRATDSSGATRTDDPRKSVVALGIEPRIVLRPTDVQRRSWDVEIEIPDLSHLLFKFPKATGILKESRCVVAGTSSRPLSGGSFLHGPRRVKLRRWPQPEEVLLQFDRTDPQIDFLLRTECLLRPGPIWLFRVASDGLAYESRSLRVRPGERYVVVRRSPISADKHIRRLDVSCEGIFASQIDIPEALSAEWQSTLRQLGLQQSKSIEVWPAGLDSVVWDGEGHGEWLTSERPCLAVRTDHPVSAVVIELSGTDDLTLDFTTVGAGEPVFVELPELPIGLHTLQLSTRTGLSAEIEPLGQLDVVIRIREARPWSAGISPQGPLVVEVDPSSPTLEQLWEGHVDVSIQGPPHRQVRCVASLFERDGQPATFTAALPPLQLPMTSERWREHFEKSVRQDVKSAYDTARFCELAFSAEELGAFVVRCDRELRPLRWAVRRDGRGSIVRLLNDSGKDGQPVITRRAFETPCLVEPIDASGTYHVPPSGGLYVAAVDGEVAAVIAPPQVTDLRDLRCRPTIPHDSRSIEAVVRCLRTARLWGEARQAGDVLSSSRQRDVLNALVQHVFRLICGDGWGYAERDARSHQFDVNRLKDAISRRPEERAVGVVLARDCDQLAAASCRERCERLALLGRRYLGVSTSRDAPVPVTRSSPHGVKGPESAEWLAELSLRLASSPTGVEEWAGEYFLGGLNVLMETRPALARAARFLVLTIDNHLQSAAKAGELYAGWRWQ